MPQVRDSGKNVCFAGPLTACLSVQISKVSNTVINIVPLHIPEMAQC